MDGLLVLLLLLSPVIYPVFAVLAGLYVSRRVRRKTGKEERWKPLRGGIITFVVIMLIPTWNILIGRAYMYYLCWKDGGLQVYEAFGVPARFFDGYGNPKPKLVPADDGNYNLRCFEESCFRLVRKSEMSFQLPPGSEVWRIETHYEEKETGKILGRYVSYSHSTWYSLEKSSAICPRITRDNNLSLNVFNTVKVESTTQGVVK